VTVPLTCPVPAGYVPLRRRDAAGIALRAWVLRPAVHVGLRRRPLPELVRRMGEPPAPAVRRHPPRRLGRVVGRALTIGSHEPRCLIAALVLYRLLRAQGEPAELVIGLPPDATGEDAHAWVEVGGIDVGPFPGRRTHVELARFA
jgi:Transglutaminase-like superfamily